MAGGYSITIQAVDKVSGVFDAANKRVEALNKRIAQARAPFDKLEQSFTKFTKVTGLAKIATGFSDVAKAGTETFRSLLRVVEPLGAITGAASVAGLYRLATVWGQFGTQLGQQAVRAGLTADKLQTLENAARLAGIPTDSLTQGMTSLNDNMRNAAFGGAPQFIQAVQALGLSYDDIKKKTPAEALGIFADKIAAIKNPTDRAAYATALFGGAGEAMLPFLSKGSRGINELSGEATKLGRNLGTDGVADADAFRKSQERVAEAAEGLANALGAKVGKALGPLLDQFANWVATSPAVEAGLVSVGEAAQRFADWLRGVNWDAVGTSIKTIADHAQAVATALGGWTNVGEDLILFFTGRFLVQMLLPFAQIASALLLMPKQAAASAAAANVELAKIGGGAVGASLQGLLATLTALGLAGYVAEKNRQDVFSRASNGDPSAIASGLTGEYIPPETGAAPDGGFGLIGAYLGRLFGRGGGGGAGPGLDTSRAAVPLKPGEQQANAKAMANVFARHGYTPEFTAALLGSGMAESSLNPHPANTNGHEGAFQWSPARQRDIEAHFNKSLASMNVAEQAEAAAWEIDTKPEFAGLKQTGRTSHDLITTNDAVTGTFEAPATRGTAAYDREASNRLALSRGAIPYSDGDVAAPPGAPVGAPSGDSVSAPNGLPGTAGANGRVDMNVRVQGAPAQVTTTSSGDVGVKVEARNVARDGY